MQITQHKLFPTLVTEINEFLTPEQCNDLLQYGKALCNEVTAHNAIVGGGVSYFTPQSDFLSSAIINVPSCIDLREKIALEISNYAATTGFVPNYDVGNSWFNIQDVGSELIGHTHASSVISGALYVNVDAQSSPITFFTPNPYIAFSALHSTNDYTEFTYEWFTFKPQLGTLLLFPSWLKHGSNRALNNTPDRMVISFNS